MINYSLRVKRHGERGRCFRKRRTNFLIAVIEDEKEAEASFALRVTRITRSTHASKCWSA